MGNIPCYDKSRKKRKLADIVPLNNPYKPRISKSELNLVVSPLKLKNFNMNRSFCPKFNFYQSSEKEFKEFYTPNLGV